MYIIRSNPTTEGETQENIYSEAVKKISDSEEHVSDGKTNYL